MSPLGRKVFLAMIPVNLLLLLWVWFGRLFFNAGGWFMIMMVAAVPFLLLGLLLTTVFAFRGSDKPHALSTSQAWAHLLTWAGMLAFGFFIVDFGDVDESDRSVFTQLVGRNDATLSTSWTLTAVSGVVTLGAWLLLLTLLVAQGRRHRSGAAVPA
jgi:hypothetical protein